MLSDEQHLQLESQLVILLTGKIKLLQSRSEQLTLARQNLEKLLKQTEFSAAAQVINSETVTENFLQNFFSYGPCTELMHDNNVEDIIINNLKPIYVHHSQHGFVSTEYKFLTQLEIDVFVKKLVLFSGRSKVHKLMDLELPDLDGRANIAHSPFGPQITLTKIKSSPFSIIDLIRQGSLNYEAAAHLWLYTEGLNIRPANMLIVGGPGVGKTTLLNTLFNFIPASDHIVTIEDTLELNTSLNKSCSRLESDDDISLADLVKNSLRMHPERIIIGEVRGNEAQDMITACNVGKYCISTIHALSSREAIMRLQNKPMNVPEMLINLIDVIIVLKRYDVRSDVHRVINEISETGGMQGTKVLLSQLFKFDFTSKKFEKTSPSTTYRDRLAEQAGLHAKDIMHELAIRAHILKTLDEQNISSPELITDFCRAYSKDPIKMTNSLGLDRSKLYEELKL